MVDAAFIVGILGNVISVLLCAAPIGAFRELIRRKSAENYNGLPYITALLCKSLWTFYGTMDPDGLLIITVNSVGVFSQLVYVIIYLIYAPSNKKVKTLILVAILNIGIPGPVITVTLVAFHGSVRRVFIGVLCAAVTVTMYAAPLSLMVTVIKTKSVEYMPFLLSFFLLLNAGAWFTFAMIKNDYYVIIANAIGILSSSAQLIIYMIYKDRPSSTVEAFDVEVEEASIKKMEEGEKVSEIIEENKDETTNGGSTNPTPSPMSRQSSMRNNISGQNSMRLISPRNPSMRHLMRNISFVLSPREPDSGYMLVP